MTATSGVHANDVTIVSLSADQLAAEEEARLAALARNRDLAIESLIILRARRADTVRVWDEKIAETERMIAALNTQLGS